MGRTNAISGLVYGFPSVTHFLGYVHALSLAMGKAINPGIKLGGCGIVCHNYQIHAHRRGGWGEFGFSLTRNPLTKDGKTPSFNEEGKAHMEVSLVIECDFTCDDFDFNTGILAEDKNLFCELVHRLASSKRLAGGIITGMAPIRFHEIDQEEAVAQRNIRRLLFKLLPGFVLRDRCDVLKKHLSENPELTPFDAMLDFYAFKSRAVLPAGDEATKISKVKWEQVPKPSGGWIVPIQLGYKAISPLYESGNVACVRDPNVPFRFVEPMYGLGEWLGIHRIHDVNSIIWRYSSENDLYMCSNKNDYKNEVLQ